MATTNPATAVPAKNPGTAVSAKMQRILDKAQEIRDAAKVSGQTLDFF